MAEQYYTADPTSESKRIPAFFSYRGHGLKFQTDAGVFSKGELDPGSRLLLDQLPALKGCVLDLGCGWGPIGIAMAKANPDLNVVMADVNHRALALAEENAKANGVHPEILESDGLSALTDRCFDAIVTNPPIRAGKQVIYAMFADAAKLLTPNGSLFLVIRKQQGAESAVKYLKTLYTSVRILEKEKGYWIIEATSRETEENEL